MKIKQNIDDTKLSDDEIIENIDRLIVINSFIRVRLQQASSGYDSISVLHAAARACRAKLCEYFIDFIQIGSWTVNFLSRVVEE